MKNITFLLIAVLAAPCVFAQKDTALEGKVAPKAQRTLAAQAKITELPVEAPALEKDAAVLEQTSAAPEEAEGFVSKREEVAEETPEEVTEEIGEDISEDWKADLDDILAQVGEAIQDETVDENNQEEETKFYNN